MQEWLLDYLVCPETGESLVLQVHENDGEEIVSGKLVNPFGGKRSMNDIFRAA